MVSYQKFVSIVFEMVGSDHEATELMSWAAARWNEQKEDLRTATVAEVKDAIRRADP